MRETDPHRPAKTHSVGVHVSDIDAHKDILDFFEAPVKRILNTFETFVSAQKRPKLGRNWYCHVQFYVLVGGKFWAQTQNEPPGPTN